MRRLLTLLFLSSALLVAAAQEAAPAAEPIDDRVPLFDGTLVRFVHASPNAGATRVVVTSAMDGLDERHEIELDYMATTEYRELTEGSYDVAIHVDGEGDQALTSTRFDAVPGGAYTVAVIGLALDEAVGEGETDTGLWAWIRGLFTPDQPALALRALILDDLGGATFGPNVPAYRIVHAAPGTDTVELVHVREDASDVLASVSYLDAGRFIGVQPLDGHLEVRAAGTTATIDEVTGIEHAPGLVHTVFLVGTPIEEVPLQTIVATAEWAQLGPLVPGPAGTRGMTGLMTVAEAATLRELLVALGQRVDDADRRLQEAEATADGPVADARQELDEAMRLLEQAHLLLDDAERRGR